MLATAGSKTTPGAGPTAPGVSLAASTRPSTYRFGYAAYFFTGS